MNDDFYSRKKKAERRIKKEVKEEREWLTKDPRPPLCFADLDQAITEDSPRGMRKAAIRLGVLASYYGRRGRFLVLDGNAIGWDDIHRSIAYSTWALRITLRIFKADVSKNAEWPLSARDDCPVAAWLFCYYLLSDDKDGQQFAIDLLRIILRITEEYDKYFWESRTFEFFVLRLAEKKKIIDLPDTVFNRDLGPYGKIFEYWDTPERLGDAVFGLCEYHCANMTDTGQDWSPEFIHFPFDLLPGEILAIYALRRKLGLETPHVEHPLLATPLADFKYDVPFQEDDILLRVRNAYDAMLHRSRPLS